MRPTRARRQFRADSRACNGRRGWVCLQPSCRHARLPDGLRHGQRGFGPAPAEPAATTAAESAALSNGSGIIRRGQPLQLCGATGLCCLWHRKALLPAGAVRRRQGAAVAVLAPQGRDPVPPPGVGHVPPPPQVVGVLCRRPHKLGPPLPRPRDSPRLLPLHPNPEAGPHSPPQAGPRELLRLGSASATSVGGGTSPVVAGSSQTASPAESSGDGSRSSRCVLRSRFNLGHRGADNRRPVCRLGRHNIFQCCRPGPRFGGQRGGPGLLWNLAQLHAGSIVRPGPPQPSTSLPVRRRPRRSRARLSLAFPPRLHGPPPTFMACR